ncbi:ricin-type beta-trefoil lectin domain protein [Dactylosporangium sp. CS-047395]|uniref:ricin-type beta-trefoil lectin domain protein n=1 Tax=Dactylosporangium sp. CS-047395 TaxID=3239936 RepID=UPI003D924F28
MRRFGVVATATAVALVASSLVAIPAKAAPSPGAGRAAAAPDKSTPVSKVPVKAPTKSTSDDGVLKALPPVSWPSAGSADSDASTSAVAPGGLPVRALGDASADAAPRTRKELSASAQQRVPVRVTVVDPAVAAAAGVRGVLLQVSRTDGRVGRAGVGLSVDYAKFAAGYGASYGSRLRLVSLPDCVLTTPSAKDCQMQSPVESVNDPVARTVTASTVSVGGAASSSSVVALASAGDGSSPEADWKATDLSMAYSWASGTSGGDFTLNYPLKAPASLGGPAPQLALGYSSGSVDAKTASKTGQSSVVGEGWDLAGGGYIERTYRTCSDDGLNIPDQCWVDKNTITMVFGGKSTKLIWNGSGWYAGSDDKLKIENPTGASNNAPNGEYWKVTTQDGTQYFFGKVRRYTSDNVNPDTASVLFEPVFGNNAGEPCYPNWCLQAYRWNLDYVVDPRGNTMTYFYDKLTGKYGPAGAAYDLSATLNRIEYGTRSGSEAGSAAPMRVVFDYAERCFAPNPCSWPPSSGHGGFADTPTDLYCAASSCSNVLAPVHFTHSRLAGVRTQVYTGSVYRNVDKWDLDQTFLTSGDSNGDHVDDTAPNLALMGLTHTGFAADGVTTQAEPKVTFGYVDKANRTDWSPTAGTAPFIHWRVDKVSNGVGGETLVDYLDSDCVNGQSKMNGDSNPFRCFPQYVKPPSAPAAFMYFNKYVVGKVTEKDLTGGSPDEVTSYSYSADGSSDTSLWAHDDVDVANVAQTSWADWRGYPTVTVTHGAVAGQQSVSRTIYQRGMSGDAKKNGTDTAVAFGQRPAFTVEPLQAGAQMAVGLAGGGTNTAGGLCLEVTGANTADGAPLRTTSCTGDPRQQWTRQIPADGVQVLKNTATGKCLDIEAYGTANGASIRQWTCTNATNQRWLRQPDGTLKNPISGRCLDIDSYNIGDNGVAHLWDCAGTWNQIWMPTNRGELVMSQNVRCAGASGSTDGSTVVNQTCGVMDHNPNQTWMLQPNGTVASWGYGGKCLDANGTTSGSPVRIWTCGTGAAQQWQPQANGTLKNPATGLCLDAGDLAIAGQTLTIRTCTDHTSQRWIGRGRDYLPLKGQVRSSYAYDNGAVADYSVHGYWFNQSATRAAFTTPGATVESWITREAQTKTATWIAATSSWRWTQTDTTFDSYGLPADVKNSGDISTTADDTCAHTDYARNTTAYLIDLPSQAVITDCAAGPHDGNYLKGTQTLYDGSTTVGAPPIQGLATQTNAMTTVSGTAITWTKQSRATYDQYGRVLDAFDALDHKTTMSYTPGGGPVTSTSITDPLLRQQVIDIEPGHGVATAVRDPNNQTVTAQYDPLGQRTKVWMPGRATNLTPTYEYSYALSNAAANAVTTSELGPNGGRIVTVELYDGRLRKRQTQAPASVAKGGRLVTDTQFDARGLAWQQSTFWDSSSAPTGQLAGFSNANVQQQTRNSFDSRERVTVAGLYSADALQWKTTTAYDGNSTTVVPPSGDTPVRRTTNAAGDVIELRQYTAGSIGGASQATTYEYDRLGRLRTVADPAGNQWSTTYDRLGRVTATTDPDTGAEQYGYDAAGRRTTSTDNRGVTLAYTYDDLNRKTAVFDGSTSGVKRAQWDYDTVRIGALTSSTRFAGSQAYTTAIDSYDAAGRPVSTTTTIPATASLPATTYTVGYTYNADGSLASTAYPAIGGLPQETVTVGYDASGRTLSMTGLDTYVADTSYYGLGPVRQQVLGTGTKQARSTRTIDERTGRLTNYLAESTNQSNTATWDERLNLGYSFDEAGNVTAIKETSGGSVVANECFAFDGLRELTEAWTTSLAACPTTPGASLGGQDSYWTSLQYDLSTGNRATEIKHGPGGNTTRTYVYPASGSSSVRPHAVTRVDIAGVGAGTDSYTYDDSGSTSSRGLAAGQNQSMVWDREKHLESVSDASGTTGYVYDADGARLLGTDPQGVTVYLPGLDLRRQGGVTTGTRYYGDVAVRTASNGVTWLMSDTHGTGQLAIKADTLAATRRRLDPFGNPRAVGGVAWPSSRGFLNGTQDNTGFTHLGAREYEPSAGRFISDDPVTDVHDAGQMNGYSYSANNPVSASDPTGTRHEPDEKWPGTSLLPAQPPTPKRQVQTKGGTSSPADNNGSAPFNSKKADKEQEKANKRALDKATALKDLACAAGLFLTCATWGHWLDRSGTTFDAGRYMKLLLADEALAPAVAGQLQELRDLVVQSCGGESQCVVWGDTLWHSVDLKDADNHYAVGHVMFRVAGYMSVGFDAQGNRVVNATYTVSVYKSWNFDPGDSFNIPGAGPYNVAPFTALHEYGLARDYAFAGESDMFVQQMRVP